jgi:ribosomal protein S18 acetylase RimI-like enzyme
MLQVEKASEKDEHVLEYLLRDPVANGFAIEDIREMPKDGEFYISRDSSSNEITGYLLNHYEGNELFVTLRSRSEESTSKLLAPLPIDEPLTIYMHTDPMNEQIVESYFLSNRREFEKTGDLVMAIGKNEAKLIQPNTAKIITNKYKQDVAKLFSHGAHDEAPEIVSVALGQQKIWGIIVDGHVVSIAAIASRQPEVGVVVNVNTHPDYRRRGYGTMVTSAATGKILEYSRLSSLFVNSSNRAAISIYEKLGYKLYSKSVRFKVRSK